jgi:hypothetical protein
MDQREILKVNRISRTAFVGTHAEKKAGRLIW